MTDELGCNNCPDKKRCDEQREHKDSIINSMLDDIKDTAIAYNCDLRDKIKVLKQNLPIITRCDVVLEKQLLRKKQECDELREYHNKCCQEFEKEKQELLDKYNQLSKDFYSGKYCNGEKCRQLSKLKSENDNLKSLIWWIHVGAEGANKAITEYYENRNTPYEENYWKRIRALQPSTYESKYKLALVEIKETVEQGVEIHDDIIVSKQIIQKISEVIE